MKKAYFFVALSILISIVALGFSLMRVVPFEPDEATYIGIMVTSLEICTAIVLGYQIYNVIATKEELKAQRDEIVSAIEKNEALKKELDLQRDVIQTQRYCTEEGLSFILALTKYNEDQRERTCLNAIWQMHSALAASVHIESTILEPIFQKLNLFIGDITENSFNCAWTITSDGQVYVNGSNLSYREAVRNYMDPIFKLSVKIEQGPNYSMIKKDYQQFLLNLQSKFAQIEQTLISGCNSANN